MAEKEVPDWAQTHFNRLQLLGLIAHTSSFLETILTNLLVDLAGGTEAADLLVGGESFAWLQEKALHLLQLHPQVDQPAARAGLGQAKAAWNGRSKVLHSTWTPVGEEGDVSRARRTRKELEIDSMTMPELFSVLEALSDAIDGLYDVGYQISPATWQKPERDPETGEWT